MQLVIAAKQTSCGYDGEVIAEKRSRTRRDAAAPTLDLLIVPLGLLRQNGTEALKKKLIC